MRIPRLTFACVLLLGTLGAVLAVLAAGEPAKTPEKPAYFTEPKRAQPPAEKSKFHLYLLMGQSNMFGINKPEEQDMKSSVRILSLNEKSEWVEAKDPLLVNEPYSQYGYRNGVGPGYPFAREMLKGETEDVTIGLIQCAIGGTPLNVWEKGPGSYAYNKAVARAREAMKAGTLKGVLWHQGESDGHKEPLMEKWISTYADRLERMFTDLRGDLGIPNLPVVVGELGRFDFDESWTGAPRVSAEAAKAVKRMTHAGWASSEGLKDDGDRLHFTAEAQREFGRRFARAMRRVQAETDGSLL